MTPAVALLVGDHGEPGRIGVVDDGPARGDGGGDPLLGDLGRHVDLDVEPLSWDRVGGKVVEPQVRHPAGGVAHLVAGRSPALGRGVARQEGRPHGGDGGRSRRVEAELDLADRAGVGVQPVLRSDLGDPAGEVDVLLGHPLDDVLGALVVAVDRVGGDQLEVDVPLADRHARVVTDLVARLAHRGDEAHAGGEVVRQVARVQSLRQLAPLGQSGLGDLCAPQHVHAPRA